MQSLNRQKSEELVIDLYYNQKKTFREIQKIVRKSPRDIKAILDVVLANIGDNLAYRHGLHFCCQEVYPYRNRNKV
jgi:hypothetical protein